MNNSQLVRLGLPTCLLAMLSLPAAAQSFRVQCPTSTITHPSSLTNVNAEPAYTSPTALTANAAGYLAPTANVNGAIKCQQVGGGDGYASMADGTQTYMFSFGPLSGLSDIANGKPGTEFPSVFNVVADASALVPHLLDALSLVPFVEEGGSLVDVGSGGGFPGIPLAIASGLSVTLVEPIRKKAEFLREAIAACGVAGEALAERAETVARDPRYRERFDYATARAVSRAPTVAELTLPLLRVGGRALLQRGAVEDRERRALDDAAPVLGGSVVEERIIDGERRVLVVEKRVPSSERFPRRNGVPEKRPLCFD